MFPRMVERIPEGKVGRAEIRHFDVNHHESAMEAIRGRSRLAPGRYAKLYVGGRLYMSDTPDEHYTNYDVVWNANGDVLIAGLGMGMILDPILAKDDVRSVTVVELDQDVIDLIGPHFPSPKLTLVRGDIFDWRPEKGRKFDVIYFDIWADQSTDDLAEMAKLHRRFARTLDRDNPKAWMYSWRKGELQSRRRREKREESLYRQLSKILR